MKKIRSDEGLTYGVTTTLGEGPYWRGDLTGGLQTKNRSVAYALRLALAEMPKLKDEPLTDAELHVDQGRARRVVPEPVGKPAGHREPLRRRGALSGWPEDWWVELPREDEGRHRRRRAADGEEAPRHREDGRPRRGQGSEIEPGDPDHPGALKDVAPLPLKAVPLRDPLTLKPMP